MAEISGLLHITISSCLLKVYRHQAHVDHLEIALCKKKIAELILDYFKAEVKHLVPLENYVIDFSVDHTAGYIKVIELNPWCDAASAALFNWDNPEERVRRTFNSY